MPERRLCPASPAARVGFGSQRIQHRPDINHFSSILQGIQYSVRMPGVHAGILEISAPIDDQFALFQSSGAMLLNPIVTLQAAILGVAQIALCR